MTSQRRFPILFYDLLLCPAAALYLIDRPSLRHYHRQSYYRLQTLHQTYHRHQCLPWQLWYRPFFPKLAPASLQAFLFPVPLHLPNAGVPSLRLLIDPALQMRLLSRLPWNQSAIALPRFQLQADHALRLLQSGCAGFRKRLHFLLALFRFQPLG